MIPGHHYQISLQQENADLVLRTNGSTRLTLASTGAATLSNALQVAGQQAAANYGGTGLNFDFTSGNIGRIASVKTTSGGSQLQFLVYNTSGTDVNALSIASTGAATFSSSVTATSFFESSDSRLKTLIQDNYQTKGIASITPKLYTKNGKVELGYYAQDFVGILDSAVSKGSDEMLSLSYREVLVAKVYALEQEIKDLKAKMN